MEDSTKVALAISKKSIWTNALLSAVKFAAGMLGHSSAMISDAIHSASDVFSTIIVILGMKAAGKDSDQEHPYGHERMECVAAILLAVALLITGLLVGYQGLRRIISHEAITVPGILALCAALVSIAVKEAMYQYTSRAAKQIHSEALMADAWHHRSDAISSIGALIGIAGAKLGFPVLDPVASLIICLMIAKAAYDIFHDAVDKMVDHRGDESMENEIRTLTEKQPGVERIDLLRSRKFGNRIYCEMEIAVNGALPLREAHAIAEAVHAEIETALPMVKHIMIHVNPSEQESERCEK